jgi:hypothetical protein
VCRFWPVRSLRCRITVAFRPEALHLPAPDQPVGQLQVTAARASTRVRRALAPEHRSVTRVRIWLTRARDWPRRRRQRRSPAGWASSWAWVRERTRAVCGALPRALGALFWLAR